MIIGRLLLGTSHAGYIAGTGDGILTAGGEPSARDIVLFDTEGLAIVSRTASLPNGRYLLNGLNPSMQYLVMARDHNKQYEPFVWDYVIPATDLTIAEQQALYSSWQT